MERDVERYLIQKVRKLGGEAYKFVSPGQDGVPDRIIILPGGRIWFVELKTETGTLSKVQRWQHKKLRKLGADVVTLYGKKGIEVWLDDIQTTRLSEKSNKVSEG